MTQLELLLERIELLAERWMDESRRNKEAHDQAPGTKENSGFRRSTWQRYVDYERRATELRNLVKYLPPMGDIENDTTVTTGDGEDSEGQPGTGTDA